MALTVIKETGAGVTGANSYASVADCDAYHEGHLYATKWSGAVTATKNAALVMATRLIDACWTFFGKKVSDGQALQWPRFECPDPDGNPDAIPSLLVSRGAFFPSDAVPVVVVQATCELARCLIAEDLVASDIGQGVASIRFAGSLSLDFTPGFRASLLPTLVQEYLSKVGSLSRGSSGAVKLQRF
jgi:hypothetical protein